jgi:hypothetical protein
MRKLLIIALVFLCAPAFGGTTYSNDFEAEVPGSVPAGWASGQWWGGALVGEAFCQVVANPYGAGQVLQLSFENNWDVHTDQNSNGYVLGPLLTAADPANAILTMEFDMYKDNWRAWELIGDNDAVFPVGGAHMNDGAGNEFKASIGDDTSWQLTDEPQNALIHVSTVFNSTTDAWEATWTYGAVDHVFTGTSTADVSPQFFFGGWFYKFQADEVRGDGGPFAQSSLFLDNLTYSVTPVPEPSILLLAGVGLLALLRRKK